MAEYNYRNQPYVYGNAVPKEEYKPERYEREERARVRSVAQRKQKEAALHMDLPYLIVLTLAAVAALAICISLLQAKNA